jgi:hypothetical protein
MARLAAVLCTFKKLRQSSKFLFFPSPIFANTPSLLHRMKRLYNVLDGPVFPRCVPPHFNQLRERNYPPDASPIVHQGFPRDFGKYGFSYSKASLTPLMPISYWPFP